MSNVSANAGDIPRYFGRDALRLRNDETGARFWSVSLTHTQLTYFEVRPNCRFDFHQHRSEQITLVLGGRVVFRDGLRRRSDRRRRGHRNTIECSACSLYKGCRCQSD
jgi:hypothetical protein